MPKMTINMVEFEFDIHDVDQAESFEKAIDQLSESEQKIKTATVSNKMSEVNRAMISMFKQFFISATDVDVIGNCKNSITATEAYYAFCEEVGKAKGLLLSKYDAKRVR